MSKVLLVLATIDAPQPANQTFGGRRLFKVGDAAQITAETQIVTDDLADGIYIATCQSLDATNAPMPDMVSLSFSLAGGQIVVPTPAPSPAPETYAAPASLGVSVVPS